MTPRFTGISVPRVSFSQLEPQKHAFFTDFGGDLRKIRAFSRKVCSLEVAVKLKVFQFTFSTLVALSEIQDSGFWVPPKKCVKKWLAKILPDHGTYTSCEALQEKAAP